MAFYADIYGFVAMQEANEIPTDIVASAHRASPIFKPNFSIPNSVNGYHYISFACRVKIDEGEDGMWISPFEYVLRKIDFVHASVNIVHEVGQIMMYSYVMDGIIKCFVSKLDENFTGERVV